MKAFITFHVSFEWDADNDNEQNQYRMHYEIEEMVKDWLIGGQKRGDFLASVSDGLRAPRGVDV